MTNAQLTGLWRGHDAGPWLPERDSSLEKARGALMRLGAMTNVSVPSVPPTPGKYQVTAALGSVTLAQFLAEYDGGMPGWLEEALSVPLTQAMLHVDPLPQKEPEDNGDSPANGAMDSVTV